MSKKSSQVRWTEHPPNRRRGSGSALLQSPADVPLVLDALLGMVRASGFGDRDVFGIRLALEEAIRQGLKHQAGREGLSRLRLRYHLGAAEMAKWMKEGTFKTREDIVQGLENFPDALLMLFEGRNFGKLVLQVASE